MTELHADFKNHPFTRLKRLRVSRMPHSADSACRRVVFIGAAPFTVTLSSPGSEAGSTPFHIGIISMNSQANPELRQPSSIGRRKE